MGRRIETEQAPDQDTGREETPSKSARKRAAAAAQQLGERLIELGDAELAALPLPDILREAVRAARGMRRGTRGRQLQYIGRLMRDDEVAPLLPEIEAALPDHPRKVRK